MQSNSNHEKKKKKKSKLFKLLRLVKPGGKKTATHQLEDAKKEEAQEDVITRNVAGGGDETPDGGKKKGGGLKKFFARGLQKIGHHDKMEVEPTFKESMDLHTKYREDLSKMNHALRLMVEPEAAHHTRGEPGPPPLECLAAALKSFIGSKDLKPLGSSKVAGKLHDAIAQMAIVDREGREKLDSSLGNIVSFCGKTDVYEKHQQILVQQLEQMNYWRELVKKSSTTQEAKASGGSYETACKKYDQSCAYIETEINGTVRSTAAHQQSFVDFCDKRAHYHTQMADLLQKFDNEITPLLEKAKKGAEKPDDDGKKKSKDKKKK